MPKVTLIAHTGLSSDFRKLLQKKMPAVGGETQAASLIEFAGRNCYQSFHRPNEATNTPEKYIHATVHDKKHYSILEHASASFLLEGVTRAFLAEITRHRHLSFSVESQRFVDSENAEFVLPPALDVLTDEELVETGIFEAEAEIREAYRCIKQALESKGVTGKKAKEAARSILPNSTSVSMVVSGNFRAWLEVLTRRTQPDVDAEFQAVAMSILVKLNKICPEVFGSLLRERLEAFVEDLKNNRRGGVFGTYLSGEDPEEAERVLEKAYKEADTVGVQTSYRVIDEVKFGPTITDAVTAVADWNIEAGQLDPYNLKWDELPHCRQAVDFLREEVNEVELAAMSLEDDRIELLDGIADVLFTLFGLAAKAGLTDKVEPAFWEVVRSNQTKLIDNKVLPCGKVGKGPHYEPPNLARFFPEGW